MGFKLNIVTPNELVEVDGYFISIMGCKLKRVTNNIIIHFSNNYWIDIIPCNVFDTDPTLSRIRINGSMMLGKSWDEKIDAWNAHIKKTHNIKLLADKI